MRAVNVNVLAILSLSLRETMKVSPRSKVVEATAPAVKTTIKMHCWEVNRCRLYQHSQSEGNAANKLVQGAC